MCGGRAASHVWFGGGLTFSAVLARAGLATILPRCNGQRATYAFLVRVRCLQSSIAMEVKMVDEKHKRPTSPPIRVHPDTVLGAQQPKEVTLEPEPAVPQEETATAIVASGRSVHINTERVQCGYDSVLGRPVFRQAFRTALPGEIVELPRSEIARLQAVGILVDPNLIAADTTTH